MTSADLAEIASQRPENWRSLHIAMIGQKGLPATFGGIEHHVEEIGRRLVERGHRVTVYIRRSYSQVDQPTYLGMDLQPAPTVGTKHLDAIVHSGGSTVLAMRSGCDVVHYHGLGPGLVAPLPRYLSRAHVVLTVHGLDHQRGKWGRAAQGVLGAAHWMSGRVPDRTIAVSRSITEHYQQTFGRDCSYIPNGVDRVAPLPAERIRTELALEPGYLLFVGRLVPEKAPDVLIRSYRQVPGERRLVIVGDSSFSDDYTAGLRALAARDPRVLLTGFVYGDLLSELYDHAAVFVQPSRLEGMPLTLLEASAHGAPVVVSDIGPHLEVVGPRAGPGRRTFATDDEAALTATLTAALSDPVAERAGALTLSREVLGTYQWDTATDELERLYLDLVGTGRRRASRMNHTGGMP